MENKTQLLFVEKKTPITFKPKIRLREVLAKIAEDKLKEVPHTGEKEVPPKAPKRRKPEDEKPAPEHEETREPKGLPKEKKAKEKELTFPLDGFINGYGFLKLKKALLDKLSWNWKPGKGNRTLVTLDVQDGVLILKKKNA